MTMMQVSDTFPRVCGGDPESPWDNQILDELFPVYAGVSLDVKEYRLIKLTFPRVCGGDPYCYDGKT